MKVKFDSEKQRYTVQASDERFAICTKPFNAQKTYLYTVCDLKKGTRGHFGKWGPPYDLLNSQQVKRCMDKLNSGHLEIVGRNSVNLSQAEISQLRSLGDE